METRAEPQPEVQLGKDIYCPMCGYNLYGAPGERCPECGHRLDNLRSPTVQIPWERRRELGRIRAYWQTVWMVTFQNLRFCEEYAKSLDVSAARLFRWITLLHVYALVLAGTLVIYATVPFEPEATDPVQQMAFIRTGQFGPTFIDRAYAEVWPVVGLHVCLLFFLVACTSAPGYLFHARSVAAQRQINAATMSHYACGPLAFMPLVPVGLLLLAEAASIDPWLAMLWSVDWCLAAGCTIATLMVIPVWWWNLVRIARRTMPQFKYRAAGVGVGVPATWFGLGVVLLVLLPLAILYVLVVVASLAGR